MPTETALLTAREIARVVPSVKPSYEQRLLVKIAGIIDRHRAELLAGVHGALVDAGTVQVDYERLGDGVRALTAERDALRSALDSALFRLGHVEEVERGRMVAAARAACVCRICGKPPSQPFVLDFGREYAHTECLDARTVPQPIEIPTDISKGEVR